MSGFTPPGQHEVLGMDKLRRHPDVPKPATTAVLVSCGSFNPPTFMHLRMFDVAAVQLKQQGVDVWGGYMSPVGNAYGKAGLLPGDHRIRMCQLAAASSTSVMVEPWEAEQPTYTRTMEVLRRIRRLLHEGLAHHPPSAVVNGGSTGGVDHALDGPESPLQSDDPGSAAAAPGAAPAAGLPKVLLLCGADVLATMAQPGVWEDLDGIFIEFGVVCVTRGGTDVGKLLFHEGSALARYREHVYLVDDSVGADVSSSLARERLRETGKADGLLDAAVLSYIVEHGLYR